MLLKEIHDHVNTECYGKHPGKKIIPSSFRAEFDDTQAIQSAIKQHGLVVINCRRKSLLITAKLIKSIFGKPIKNTAGGRTGYISRIRKSEIKGRFRTYTASEFAEPLHTDGGHLPIFPRFVSFYCVQPALNGGLSTIVSVRELLESLYQKFNEEIYSFLQPNFLQIDTMYSRNISKQLFFRLENNEIGLSYWPVMFNVKTSETGSNMLLAINKFIHDPVNQYRFKLEKHELLVVDNCRVLHSRTAFHKNDQRCLLRLWNGLVEPGKIEVLSDWRDLETSVERCSY
ncbi:MAG: TauD/TfdA family dioxygenase [Legionellaceae bacterium]|nr:TauD/TfdA family dioxygenase [Legionellaceae bacterium]